MRIRILTVSLVFTSSVWGQKHFEWQDLCFKNPASPVCKGNDYAVKPTPKPTAPRTSINNPFPPKTSQTAAPSMIVIGKIDWRFADPFADALIGIDFNALTASPIARNLIVQLGAQQGLGEADVKKIFEGLSGVDQVALSVRNNRVVVMITGHVTDTALPAPEAGLKAVPVTGGSMLIGHADAVDQAMQRIAMKGAPSDFMRMAEAWQASSEFWATGSPGLLGPQAASAGIKRFSLSVSMRNRLTSDLAFEFNRIPPAATLQSLQTKLGTTSLEGNTVHLRTSIEAEEAQQKLGEIAASPLGQPLGALIGAARYLPVPETAVPRQTKPIIYGLDDGPREVNQYPGR